MGWEYRVLDQVHEINSVVELEISIGQRSPKDVVPSSLYRAVAHTEGLAAGAFDGRKLIGIAFAFPFKRTGLRMLWSHLVGVHPDYQEMDICFGLKQFQRMWALEHGYDFITWVFDPLQVRIANFSLHQLGAVPRAFHKNFYGESSERLNAGLSTDCLEVLWDLRNSQVKDISSLDIPSEKVGEIKGTPLLWQAENGQIVLDHDVTRFAGDYLVEIPSDINVLKEVSPSVALDWQYAFRELFDLVFSRGYEVVDVVYDAERFWYLFSNTPTWLMYVLKCSDESLYTGITTNLVRRLRAHNSGHGAAYTASRRPVWVVAAWRFLNRSAALRAERSFKKMSRSRKLKFVNEHLSFLAAPFVSLD